MRLPTSVRWIGLAALGIVIAVAVAIAASQAVSQQIGIASESVSAGDALAPALRRAGGGQGSSGIDQTNPTPGGEAGDGHHGSGDKSHDDDD